MNNVLILFVNTINKKIKNRIIITIGYNFYKLLGKRIINNNKNNQ